MVDLCLWNPKHVSFIEKKIQEYLVIYKETSWKVINEIKQNSLGLTHMHVWLNLAWAWVLGEPQFLGIRFEASSLGLRAKAWVQELGLAA